MWDLMHKEAEISREVNDDRIFAAVWAYLTVAYWIGDASGPAAEILVDPYSRTELGEVIITGSAYVDVAVRWPQLFAYSQANIFPA
jgi:hypothetical protein